MTNKERRKPEVGLGGLFTGLGNFLDLVSQLAETGEEIRRQGEVRDPSGQVRGVYGFSVRMGMGGQPVIEHFGNIRESRKGPVVAEVREPLVDVLEEEGYIRVIAELPGVEEKSVHLGVKGDILEISAEGKDRKYHKEVLLPTVVEAAPRETSYRNGILEVKLVKAQGPKSGG